MSKYLVIWEVDVSQMPDDPKERIAVGIKLDEMIKQDMKDGKISDWGAFIGGNEGYAVVERNGLDLHKDIQRYRPYITCNVQEVLSVDEILEVTKSLMK